MATLCALHLLASSFPERPHTTYSDLKTQEKAEGEEASAVSRPPGATTEAFGVPSVCKVIWGRHSLSPQFCPLEESGTSKSMRIEGTVVAWGAPQHGRPARGLAWFLDDHFIEEVQPSSD